MNNNLLKSILFLAIGILYAVAKALGVSVLSTGESVVFAIIDVALALFFFVLYKKEKKGQ